MTTSKTPVWGRVLVHALWPIRRGALTSEALERMNPYVVRYAQTLGAGVPAVGGANDHLHVVLDLPPAKSVQEISDELQRATMHFLRDVLNQRTFAWDEDATGFASVSPDEVAALAEYVENNAARHEKGDTIPAWEGEEDAAAPGDAVAEDLPDWLRDVMPGRDQ